MLENCSEACAELEAALPIPESFYSITEPNLDPRAKEVVFESFKGKVVYVVNVASQCGYTRENYESFRMLAPLREQGLEIVLAPCNQFGAQEPGDHVAIARFAKQEDFEGIILKKSDVNGPKTRPLFRYLKNASGYSFIQWNFDGKFLISKTGVVHRVEDLGLLEQMVHSLLAEVV